MNQALCHLRTALLLAATILSLSGKVLDDFDDQVKTAWEDFRFALPIPYSSVRETDGQLRFSLVPVGQSIFAASTKTSELFELKEGRTIEFRVDLVDGNGADTFAGLAFIPLTPSLDELRGYGFAKSTTEIRVSKALGQNFLAGAPAQPIRSQNVTLVLSLTAHAANVTIITQILDREAGNAVLFEQKFVDTPQPDLLAEGVDSLAPHLGAGRFVLFCHQDQGTTQSSYDATFDNAETFVQDRILLDDFEDGSRGGWQDFDFPTPIDYSDVVEENGQLRFTLLPLGSPIFSASAWTSRPFDLAEGGRLEFRVDLVAGNGADAFAVLAFIPTTAPLDSLTGYGFAKSTTDILVTKALDKYFYNQEPALPVKNEKVTLSLSLTVRNGSVHIQTRVLDLERDDAVIFERNFVDTPIPDILDDGIDNGPPYLGAGRFVLIGYEDDGKTQESYEVIFDNAVALAAPLGNAPPVFSNLSPEPGRNFVPATALVSFNVSDDRPLPEPGLGGKASYSITLNGREFLPSNGLKVVGAGSTRRVTLEGLAPNVSYVARLAVTDSNQAETVQELHFDTFAEESFVAEAEDYNYSGGLFLNAPVPIPEGTGPQPLSFANQKGVKGVDYQDTRTDLRDAPYRPEDHVRMNRSLDFTRAKFTAAGGPAAPVYDYDVRDIAAGEWLQYTRVFVPGDYRVYLREALRNGTQVQTALEAVTSGPAAPNPTTRPLGLFAATTSGFQFRNVPLTDAVGQPVTLSLSGETTFRLRQISGAPADGDLLQNYLIFIPTRPLPIARALVSSVSPAAGEVVETVTPSIQAQIVNRATSVQLDTVKLFLNGGRVPAQVGPSPDGAVVNYSIAPLPLPGALLKARLEFGDSGGVVQTNEWQFTITYHALNPAYRADQPGAARGFRVHVVQAPPESGPLENSLARAEEQLAENSRLARALDTNRVVQLINLNGLEGNGGEIPGDAVVPGLESAVHGLADFAVEILTYLELPAGAHRFGVISDDGFLVSSVASFADRSAPSLASRSGGTANLTYDLFVTQAGLYPFRLVWYQRGGSAHLEWFWVRPDGSRQLLNDPSSPTALRAYATLVVPAVRVESAPSLRGVYAEDPTAVVDTRNNRAMIPFPLGHQRYYRLVGSGKAWRITGVRKAGVSMALTFE